jgi:hypothetical protein
MGPSYVAIVAAARAHVSWLLLVDSDEYVFAVSPRETLLSLLRSFVEKHPNAGAINVPWQFFGSNGHDKMPKCIIPSFKTRKPFGEEGDDEDAGGSISDGKQGDPQEIPHPRTNLVKSFVRPDALPGQHYQVNVPGVVHGQPLCSGWVTLSANGERKSPFNRSALSEKKKGKIDSQSWVMHDWVDLDTAAMRLHHYRSRSREWLLKVRACRTMKLTGHLPPPWEAKELLRNQEEQDAKATVCDSTLAERQAFGPGSPRDTTRLFSTLLANNNSSKPGESDWAAHVASATSNSIRGGCSALAIINSMEATGASETVSNLTRLQQVKVAAGSYVDLGDGCGLHLKNESAFKNKTLPSSSGIYCNASSEDSAVMHYSHSFPWSSIPK